MWILYAKVLHIFGFVAWFAGLFYLVRMFVYHVEADDKPQPDRAILQDQYHIMQGRVYQIIINPAMMLTWIGGLTMIVLYGWEWFTVNYWLHFKLVLLLGLVGYQIYCKKIIVRLERGERPLSAWQFRLLNEIPTVFLLTITLLAVLRNALDAGVAFATIILFMLLLYVGARLYRARRERTARTRD